MLASLLISGLLAGDEAEVVRLRVGKELVVRLDRDSFDEAVGIRGWRLDDGGVVDLRWDQMVAEDVERIRRSFGYLPDEPEPLMVSATRVTMTSGAEFVGILVNLDDETFTIHKGTKVWPLRWAAVRSRETVEVDALEVYEGEVLYAQRLAEQEPRTPLDHYNLALFCESLLLWGHVQEHLAVVTELDPSFKADLVAAKQERAALRIEAGEDAELLAKVLRLAAREDFDGALALVDGFLAENRGSKLAGEFQRERGNLLERRQKWLDLQVLVSVFAQVERLAYQFASDDAVGWTEARREMERAATDTALELVAQQLGASVEEVRQTWEAEDRPVGAPRTASYGGGTFTLGEKRVFEGLDDSSPEAAEEDGKSAAKEGEQSLEDRIREAIEERKKRAEERKREGPKSKPKFKIQDVPPDRDEWWAAAPAKEKQAYLLAYWAEADPHVQVVQVFARNCVRCAGAGVLEYFDRNTQSGRAPCERCKTLRIDRVIRYR